MTKSYKSNPMAKFLDSIFDDKCLYNKNGSIQRGPGIICGLYIFLLITGCIVGIIMTQSYTKYGLTRESIIIQNVLAFVILLFSVYFIYHMCYICRGFMGFIVLFLFTIITFIIRWYVFTNYYKHHYIEVI